MFHFTQSIRVSLTKLFSEYMIVNLFSIASFQ